MGGRWWVSLTLHPPYIPGLCLSDFFSSRFTDDGFVFFVHQAELHQQVFQRIHCDGGRDDEVFVVDDFVSQITVLLVTVQPPLTNTP